MPRDDVAIPEGSEEVPMGSLSFLPPPTVTTPETFLPLFAGASILLHA